MEGSGEGQCGDGLRSWTLGCGEEAALLEGAQREAAPGASWAEESVGRGTEQRADTGGVRDSREGR